MKSNFLFLLALVALLTGCAHVFDRAETVTPAGTNVIYTVSTNTVAHIDAAKSVAGLIPAPYATPVELGLTLLSGVLGLIARQKSKTVDQQQTALDKTNTVLSSVIAGVETANHPETKQAIAQSSARFGVADTLHTLVQSIT